MAHNITGYETIILPVVLYGCGTWSLTLREECRVEIEGEAGEVTGVVADWIRYRNPH